MYRELPTFCPEEILVYLRKSRADDPSLSVDEVLARHEELLRDWIERNLVHAIPEENYFREVVSGETIKDRPEFRRVLRKIESPKTSAILVVEVQRLSRGDLEDAGRLIKLLRYTHTMVITPQKVYDLEDEYDRDLFERELKRGNDYLEYTKRILNRGRILSVQNGNYIGNTPPYGFDKCWTLDGKKRVPTLKENEKADIVRTIFRMVDSENMSPYAVAKYLDSIGEPAPSGKHWTYNSVLGILRNRHYDKKVIWGHRSTQQVVIDGHIQSTRPRQKEYLVADGRQPRVIDHEVFERVQKAISGQPRTRRDLNPVNPFAGIVYCANCGRSLSFRFYRRAGRGETCPPRMLCSDQIHCKSSSCYFYEFSEAVQKVLQKHIYDFSIQLDNLLQEPESFTQDNIRLLENRLNELKQKELRQWEKYADGEMPKEIFDQLNERIQKNKQAAQIALDAAREAAPDTADEIQDKITRLSDALRALQDDTIPVSLKNQYLKAVIERIDYSRPASIRALQGTTDRRHGGWSTPPFELQVHMRF